MTNLTVYKMTEQHFKKLLTHGLTKMICYTCREKIKVGQDVCSTIKSHGRILRHKNCAERVGLI